MRKTVLVVDDNRGSRVIFAAWLRYAGYFVIEAEEGEQAVPSTTSRPRRKPGGGPRAWSFSCGSRWSPPASSDLSKRASVRQFTSSSALLQNHALGQSPHSRSLEVAKSCSAYAWTSFATTRTESAHIHYSSGTNELQEIETRRWVGPDRKEYQLRITEQLSNDGDHLRRIRRIHFESHDGRVEGAAVVPGYFVLALSSSLDLYDLWRKAVGISRPE